MTHTVVQSDPMTPDEFRQSRHTHLRNVGDPRPGTFETARILAGRDVNARGHVAVEFDNGDFGALPLAAIGESLELTTPLRDAPTELWFARATHSDQPFYDLGIGRSLPSGLRFGPYLPEYLDELFVQPHGDTWKAHTWIRYDLTNAVKGGS